MSARRALHPQLFDTKPYARTVTPEEKGPQAWMEHHAAKGNLVHHATFREDWQEAPTVHAGTVGQASYRLDSVATTLKHSPLQAQSYYNPDTPEDGYDDEPEEGTTTHTGRVHAFRMSGGVHPSTMSDPEANEADYLHQLHQGAEDWEISRSVKESLGPTGRAIQEQVKWGADDVELPETTPQRALRSGQALKYRNTVESDQQVDASDDPQRHVSHLVPRSAVRTWEQDVLANPHASVLAQQYATQRVKSGRAGAISFPALKPTPGSGQSQHRLFGGGVDTVQPKRRTINDIQFETVN